MYTVNNIGTDQTTGMQTITDMNTLGDCIFCLNLSFKL